MFFYIILILLMLAVVTYLKSPNFKGKVGEFMVSEHVAKYLSAEYITSTNPSYTELLCSMDLAMPFRVTQERMSLATFSRRARLHLCNNFISRECASLAERFLYNKKSGGVSYYIKNCRIMMRQYCESCMWCKA